MNNDTDKSGRLQEFHDKEQLKADTQAYIQRMHDMLVIVQHHKEGLFQLRLNDGVNLSHSILHPTPSELARIIPAAWVRLCNIQ